MAKHLSRRGRSLPRAGLALRRSRGGDPRNGARPLLREGLGGGMLAYNDGEFSAGTGEHRSAVHASEIFNRHRTPGSDTTLKALVLGNTVRVPRHLSLSWECSHTVSLPLCMTEC